MGILDEAIREHLELKRQHGAEQTELEKLEDEAFGAPGRPGEEASDNLAEAPTEFMAQPEAPDEVPEAAPARSEGAARIADLQEAPEAAEEQIEEEPSATEHEIVSEPVPSGPTTEEREVISEQPTEMHDVEEELAEEDQGEEEADVVDLEEDEEDDDFWDEQRLSDELDQALEAPLDAEEGSAGEAGEVEPEAEDEGPEAAQDPAAEAKDDDVLEETPEFLEQSPEDDELWFEQKPPKDFDFDD
ncbi:MAG TPA: hypothetical protein VGF09_07615 [Solirubrobacterales bacterium]